MISLIDLLLVPDFRVQQIYEEVAIKEAGHCDCQDNS